MNSPPGRERADGERLPPLSPSLMRSSSHTAQQSSSSTNPSSSRSPLLPPPPPARLHSYHHPISASYGGSGTSAFASRSRQAPPAPWAEHRSPPLEHRSSEASSSFSSRILPPLAGPGSSSASGFSTSFNLPSLSSSLPGSASWTGSDSFGSLPSRDGRDAPFSTSYRAAANRSDNGSDMRFPMNEQQQQQQQQQPQQQRIPSLSPHLGAQGNGTLQRLQDAALLGSLTSEDAPTNGRKVAKAHVPSACLNCKRAHLACDVGRPCRRCINLGKSDTCIDVQHKKRGRPRLKDRPASQTAVATLQTVDARNGDVGLCTTSAAAVAATAAITASPSSSAYTRYSPSSEPGYFRSPTRTSDMLSPPLLASTSTTSTSVVQVAGRTHGPGMHHRSASASVSASSYPYSRPDHLRDGSDSDSVGRVRPHAAMGHQMPQPAQHDAPQSRFAPIAENSGAVSAVVTLICSTNLQCARISDECTALLGYQPEEMIERSLFEFVHPSETSRLEEIWSSLIDPVGVVPQAVPAAAEVVMSTPAARLMTPAGGTIFVQENMRLRQRSGMYDFYSVRLHLGGGFGVDLYRRETLDRAYIVASLLKLGNDAVHPDPAILRTPYLQQGTGTGRGFRTPTAVASATAPGQLPEKVAGRAPWKTGDPGTRPDDAGRTPGLNEPVDATHRQAHVFGHGGDRAPAFRDAGDSAERRSQGPYRNFGDSRSNSQIPSESAESRIDPNQVRERIWRSPMAAAADAATTEQSRDDGPSQQTSKTPHAGSRKRSSAELRDDEEGQNAAKHKRHASGESGKIAEGRNGVAGSGETRSPKGAANRIASQTHSGNHTRVTKATVYSPPSAVRSLLSDRSRASDRDGILC
ncbi:hypothetical protein BCV70DRAFT_200766 [Testicularia cyperi]|uniref:Transcription activator of gluconeogenesis ERT1 n=1 Tax=Testicularia cyperi TaxID=1882483 RepID=A0A317XPR1_9BASI|nr:hypothetical protein BCV70DRAFT_200766 [Testicularia cyperi]